MRSTCACTSAAAWPTTPTSTRTKRLRRRSRAPRKSWRRWDERYRRQRVDPIYRKALSASLGVYLRAFFGVRSRDSNSPFRLYRAEVLRQLLESIPDGALIPSVYLTVLAARSGAVVSETEVAHFVRRGGDARGTMWRGQRIPVRLIRLSYRALRASVRLRRQ